MKKRNGFTMVELMLSIALLAIMLVLPVMYVRAAHIRFDFNSQVSVMVSYLRLAQSDSVSGKGDAVHGIHLDSDAYVVFTGDTYNPVDSSNFVISLPDTIVIRNISLEGGGNDILFDRVNGGALSYGTFDLYSEQIDKSLTIIVTPLGNINY